MGKTAKHIDIVLATGKKHLSKAEVALRRDAEQAVTVDTDKISCPPYVRDNFQAYALWRKLMALYKDATFISAQDTQHLAGYCMAHSEYMDLVARRKRISETDFSWEEEALAEGETYATAGEKASIRLWKKIDYIISQDGILDLDKAINAKMGVLQSYADRLYLNPRARAQLIAPKKDRPVDPLEAQGFA